MSPLRLLELQLSLYLLANVVEVVGTGSLSMGEVDGLSDDG